MIKDTAYYENLEKLLHNRGYIDYLLEELEIERGVRLEVGNVINTCVINTMELLGESVESVNEMKNLLR